MKSLRSEIAALRAELDDRIRRRPSEDRSFSSSSAPSEKQGGGTGEQIDVEKLLEMMNITLDEFSDELDKYPRLTALAALGVGLTLGVLIGRQIR